MALSPTLAISAYWLRLASRPEPKSGQGSARFIALEPLSHRTRKGHALPAPRSGLELGCLQAPHHLLHGVVAHVPVQQRLFGFLGQRLLVGEGEIALQQNFARRDMLAVLAVSEAVGNAVAQLEFADAPAAAERKDLLFLQLVH